MENKYAWLLNEPNLPLIAKALQFYGINEIAGDKHNPVIMGWAKELGPYLGAAYKADETPWCGVFMGIVALRSGQIPPKICIRAKEWGNFGKPKKIPQLSDVLVFTRNGGGGHVGLYVAEDEHCFHVLGGNQGDAVSIVRIGKNRIVAARESIWQGIRPANVRRVLMDITGKISHNEA